MGSGIPYGWVEDTVDNVYKNHVFSNKHLEESVADLIFAQFAESENALGKRAGETINIPRIAALEEPSSAVISSEFSDIPEMAFNWANTSATIKQYGRSVPFTSWAQDLTKFDLHNKVQKVLMKLGTQILDTEAGQNLLSGKIKYTPDGTTSKTITTNGVFSGIGQSNLNYFHVETIRDYMKGTLKVPELRGGGYICAASVKALRGLRDDGPHQVWHQYTDPKNKWNGEQVKIENVRFIESNHETVLGNVGSGSGTGEAVFFGDDALGLATVITPHLRVKKAEKYGLSKGIAWYGAFVFFEPWPTGNKGEAKKIHFGSL